MSQKESSLFWEVIISVILSKKSVYIHVSYWERCPKESYFTVQYTVRCTDEQHAMSSHELRTALMLTVEFSKMCYYGLRVDSASNRNEYQGFSRRVKRGRRLSLTTLPPSVSRFSTKYGSLTSHKPMGLNALLLG
jgi:hypothetical protein